MTQIPNKAGRQGWQKEEHRLLQQEIERVRNTGMPLRSAFENVAKATGRKPNSIRNYYYAAMKEGELTPGCCRPPFTPFLQEETDALIEQVLSAQAQGVSVRSITMAMGKGDKKTMLRYQNKYRSMVKHNPQQVLRIHRRMKAEGKPTFDPYAEERPHRSGRKRSEAAAGEDAARSILESVSRIPSIDAAVFLQQLAAIVELASKAEQQKRDA